MKSLTPSDLRSLLEQQFDLVVFRDLADLRSQHRTVFDLFSQVHQDRFEDNQRLVFYSAQVPEQSFIDHIQRAAARIDISNFFILMVCPEDIQQALLQANQRFGYDDSVIQHMIYPLANTLPFGEAKFVVSDTLCALPFVQLEVGQSKTARPCCKFQGTIADLNHVSLSEAFFSQAARTVRGQMLSGIRPSQCDICWQHEVSGTVSLRQLSLLKYQDKLDQGWLDDPQLRDLTWSPSSLCNFTCRICNDKTSSSIAAESIHYAPTPEIKQQLKILAKQYALGDTQTIIQSVGKLPALTYLHLLGGEPLIWPQLEQTLAALVDSGQARNINLEFNTNGSIYPHAILEYAISNFKSIELLLSIDNVGSRFEIERGGSWLDVEQNVKRFGSLRPRGVKVKLAVTVNLQNLLYLDDVVDFARRHDLEILWWYLENPHYLSIDQATNTVKHNTWHLYHAHHEQELRNIAHRVKQSPGSDGKQFVEYINLLDQRRNQKFYHTHQEIYQAMGGCASSNQLL